MSNIATPSAAMKNEASLPVDLHFATQSDDREIRQLLRSQPMGGKIQISLEREPDYFKESRHLLGEQKTIVLRSQGRVVGAGGSSTRKRFVNGTAEPVGYLGGLRRDESVAGRFDILVRAYDYFRPRHST